MQHAAGSSVTSLTKALLLQTNLYEILRRNSLVVVHVFLPAAKPTGLVEVSGFFLSFFFLLRYFERRLKQCDSYDSL